MLPIFAVLGTTEIILIVFAILLLFGARKLPDLARSMGSSVHEFKRGMNDGAAGKDAPRTVDAKAKNGASPDA